MYTYYNVFQSTIQSIQLLVLIMVEEHKNNVIPVSISITYIISLCYFINKK